MDFTVPESAVELGALTRTIATKLVTDERQRALDAQDVRFDAALWDALIEAGVVAAVQPEAAGGGGLVALEWTAVLRELGRVAAAVPYLPVAAASSVVATFGADSHRSLLQDACSGSVLTYAIAEELNDDLLTPAVAAAPDGDGWALSGAKVGVPYAQVAASLLVTAACPAGVAVFVVDPGAPGVAIEAETVVDHSPSYRVTFSSTPGTVLGAVADGVGAVRSLVLSAQLGLAATQFGVLDRALELVSAYGRERVQFDRPIGSFQAVAQRLANAYIDVSAVRLSVLQAAWQISAGLDATEAVAVAKFWAADAGHRVAHTVIHVHGGMGLDLDHPVHRYFLAAKANEFALGGATAQLRTIGQLLAASA